MTVKIKVKAKNTGVRLERALDKFAAEVQGKVVLAGVAAMAKVFYEEAKLNTSGSRGHPFPWTGTLHESIYRVYVENESTDTKKIYHVGWNHKTAPHGHLIEFGTVKAPAYPFLRPAFDQVAVAIQAGKDRMRERIKDFRSST